MVKIPLPNFNSIIDYFSSMATKLFPFFDTTKNLNLPYKGVEYWKNYLKWMDPDFTKYGILVEEVKIISKGYKIHLDVFDAGKNRPTVVWAH